MSKKIDYNAQRDAALESVKNNKQKPWGPWADSNESEDIMRLLEEEAKSKNTDVRTLFVKRLKSLPLPPPPIEDLVDLLNQAKNKNGAAVKTLNEHIKSNPDTLSLINSILENSKKHPNKSAHQASASTLQPQTKDSQNTPQP